MKLDYFIKVARQMLFALTAWPFLALNFFMLFNLTQGEFNIATRHTAINFCYRENPFIFFFAVATLKASSLFFAVRTVFVNFLPLLYAILTENCTLTLSTENRSFLFWQCDVLANDTRYKWLVTFSFQFIYIGYPVFNESFIRLYIQDLESFT